MIQMYTYMDVADNTGAKECMCIKVLGGTKRRYAGLGDVVIASACRTPHGRGRCCTTRSYGRRSLARSW